MERFDRKDPEIHFRELAQLKQTGSAESFISEFQRLAVMVTDVSESRLTMLFTEALMEPLWGWVKAYKPLTLQDAISRARPGKGSSGFITQKQISSENQFSY